MIYIFTVKLGWNLGENSRINPVFISALHLNKRFLAGIFWNFFQVDGVHGKNPKVCCSQANIKYISTEFEQVKYVLKNTLCFLNI